MRFCFELDAVEDIEPWGKGQDRQLHWFGLTSGRYWISTPLGEALRYTDEQVKLRGLDSPYVDYQVARIFEDVQSVLPMVLEAVPSDIATTVIDEKWFIRFERWIEGSPDEKERRNLYYEIMSWYQERSLDTMYLTSGPLFHMWRMGDSVSVRWRQTGKNLVQIWAVPEGRFAIEAEQFRSTVYKFLYGVLRAMQERVDSIQASGWLRQDCYLDIPLLLKEQKERTAKVERLKQRSIVTDWEAVRRSLEHFHKN